MLPRPVARPLARHGVARACDDEMEPGRSRHRAGEARMPPAGRCALLLLASGGEPPLADGMPADGRRRGHAALSARSEERRVGKECVSTGRTWWGPSK